MISDKSTFEHILWPILWDARFTWSNYYGNVILRLKPRYYGLATADINYAHIEESFMS